MKGSLYLGKIAGIKVFVHWTFSILLIWVLISNFRDGNDLSQAVVMITLILSVFVCVTLHELGHALAARYFNYQTRDITLLPIGGMARMDELPEQPKQELVVALAGPLVNVIISIVLTPIVFMAGSVPTEIDAIDLSWENFLFHLLLVNFMLAVFNLVPAFPMDGGRVFRALLCFTMNRVKATYYAARAGQIIAVLFFFGGFFANPFLSLIGIFIFIMAQSENDQVRARSLLKDYHVRDVVITKYHSLDINQSIGDAVDLLLDVQAKDFVVKNQDKLVGTLSRNDLIKVLSEHGRDVPIVQAVKTDIKHLDPDVPLEKVFIQLGKGGGSVLPVIQNDKIIGIVDLDNITELMMIRSAVAKAD